MKTKKPFLWYAHFFAASHIPIGPPTSYALIKAAVIIIHPHTPAPKPPWEP